MLYRPGTKRFTIEELYLLGKSKQQALVELQPKVEAQQEPWIFKRTTPDGREALPIELQRVALKFEISRVYAMLDRQT
jgi:hypothetical protein